MTNVTIDHIAGQDPSPCMEDLAEILKAAVEAGASVGFIVPFELEDARAFWREKVFPSVVDGGRCLLVARTDDRIVGTVQLVTDMLPSQVHRCEVSKLLVHPDSRRQGIARLLMSALEDLARQQGRSLVTLDTKTGDMAEPLYASMGYQTAGVIPGYCRDSHSPVMDSTTYMYKDL